MAFEWKPIPGYDGFEACEDGSIRRDGVVLRPQRMSHGYMRVTIGKGKRETVHKLVALAFLGPRPDKHDVRHLNGDRAANRANNLAYGTRADNIADTMAHGKVPKGEKHHAAKLTEADVIDIKTRLRGGERQSMVAKAYGIGADEVSRIHTGKRWAHVGGVA